MNEIINGGKPELRKGEAGFANGTKNWNDAVFEEFSRGMHPTYRWGSLFPGEIMESWMNDRGEDNGELPYLLARSGGKVYAPSLMIHPVKTDRKD